MLEVEVSLKGHLAEALGELRIWLDRHQCTPENFEIARSGDGALILRMCFVEHDLAAQFEREFGQPKR